MFREMRIRDAHRAFEQRIDDYGRILAAGTGLIQHRPELAVHELNRVLLQSRGFISVFQSILLHASDALKL